HLVNLEMEPVRYSWMPNRYFVREAGIHWPVSGTPVVPAPWNDLLLPSPFTGKVTQIERTGREATDPDINVKGEIVRVTLEGPNAAKLQPGMEIMVVGKPVSTTRFP